MGNMVFRTDEDWIESTAEPKVVSLTDDEIYDILSEYGLFNPDDYDYKETSDVYDEMSREMMEGEFGFLWQGIPVEKTLNTIKALGFDEFPATINKCLYCEEGGFDITVSFSDDSIVCPNCGEKLAEIP